MKRAAPLQTTGEAPTYTLVTLAAAARVSVRTARYYLTHDVIPRPAPRGRATAYTDDHLWRLRAARRLRFDGLRLEDIRRRLTSMSLAAVRDFVEPPPPPAPTPAVMEIPMERWERATLLPGLELLVRADAGPLVTRVAREIVANYRAS